MKKYYLVVAIQSVHFAVREHSVNKEHGDSGILQYREANKTNDDNNEQNDEEKGRQKRDQELKYRSSIALEGTTSILGARSRAGAHQWPIEKIASHRTRFFESDGSVVEST